ncbi:hypothetical protein [Streptomyces sp. NPDC017993]|uniref:hypothetical protein n=1 Tax=Streptomyces sp. NPDC017993 TaxID=3365027 RepID=UPI0037BD013A
MTDQPVSEDGVPISFAVPISEPFAQAAAQVLKDVRELADDGFPDSMEGAGTPFSREAESFWSLPDPVGEARRSMLGLILELGQLSWANALDHVRALEQDIIMKPPPVWSPLTLGRAVMENCLLLHYLLDPSISGAKRLARWAGLRHTDIEHMEKTAVAFGPEQVARVAELKTQVQRGLVDVGATECSNPNGRVVGYEVDHERAGLDINLTEEAKALPAYLLVPYRVLSGAAHGRPWMTGRARELAQGTGEPLAGEAATVMHAVMAVIGSLETALVAWQDYCGADLSDTLQGLLDRRMTFFIDAVGLTHEEMP